MADAQAHRQRLFFALWPPPEVAYAAWALARDRVRRGRRLPAENLHVTLAFLGDVADGDKASLEEAAASVSSEPFVLELGSLGCWPRRGIVWLAASRVPEALARLHAELSAGLAAVGFTMERRRFLPHVTLARRGYARPETLAEPLCWTVSGFRLVRSRLGSAGAVYETVGQWSLGVGGTP